MLTIHFIAFLDAFVETWQKLPHTTVGILTKDVLCVDRNSKPSWMLLESTALLSSHWAPWSLTFLWRKPEKSQMLWDQSLRRYSYPFLLPVQQSNTVLKYSVRLPLAFGVLSPPLVLLLDARRKHHPWCSALLLMKENLCTTDAFSCAFQTSWGALRGCLLRTDIVFPSLQRFCGDTQERCPPTCRRT